MDAETLRLYRKFPGTWARYAIEAIAEVHADLPEEMPLADRMSAVDAAYPFGPREYFPYKEWLRVRRHYLEPYGYVSKGKPRVGKPREEAPETSLFAESPLERLYRRSRLYPKEQKGASA
jgi:hypothetical protein